MPHKVPLMYIKCYVRSECTASIKHGIHYLLCCCCLVTDVPQERWMTFLIGLAPCSQMTNAILTYSALQHVVSALSHTKGQMAQKKKKKKPRAERLCQFPWQRTRRKPKGAGKREKYHYGNAPGTQHAQAVGRLLLWCSVQIGPDSGWITWQKASSCFTSIRKVVTSLHVCTFKTAANNTHHATCGCTCMFFYWLLTAPCYTTANNKQHSYSFHTQYSICRTDISVTVIDLQRRGNASTKLLWLFLIWSYTCDSVTVCVQHIWVWHGRESQKKQTPTPPRNIHIHMLQVPLEISLLQPCATVSRDNGANPLFVKEIC